MTEALLVLGQVLTQVTNATSCIVERELEARADGLVIAEEEVDGVVDEPGDVG
jgi:hypothetical protein